MLSIAHKQVPGARPTAARPPHGDDTPASPTAESVDNRSAARHPASSVSAITGLRFSPHGVDAKLVNISETGVLAECGERLKPGSALTVVFEGTFEPRTMEGRVARNSVSSMGADGRLRYHVGISFARPIRLDHHIPEAQPEQPVVPAVDRVLAAEAPAADTGGVPVQSTPIVRNRW
jgi:hypothetical protein